jgi:single-strand DNA-binding protein
MRSVNKVILIGNLGSDPELRRTQSGQAVATFRLATNESWADRDGNRQERTEWHRIVAWARLAEIVDQYMKKGRQVFVEGRIQTRQWQDQQGQTRYTTEIVAQNIMMLGSRGDADADAGAGRGAAAAARTTEPVQEAPPYDDEPAPIGGEEDSDLPF